jgi:hypothetical protein
MTSFGGRLAVAVLILLALDSAYAQPTILKCGAQINSICSPRQVADQKGLDPETGQAFSTNSQGRGCKRPYQPPGNPPLILLYEDTVHGLCYWWAPNNPDEQYGRPSPNPSLDPTQSYPPQGGYDPCANPVPPPGCPNAPQQGKPQPTRPDDCLDQEPQNRLSQERIRRTGLEALDTMAAMGQQADRMLEVMGQGIIEQLAYLSQPNAELWRQ